MTTTKTKSLQTQLVTGKVGYLLALVILVQFIYPITADGSVWSTIVYQTLYASMIAVGVILASDTRRHLLAILFFGVVFLISGAIYAFYPTQSWALFLGYFTIFPFQAMIIQILLRFIFISRTVTRDVLYAACAVYLMLGGIFVPVYGLIETIQPGSFVDGMAPDAPVYWQQFIYYSYVSLTTMGYGDILPVTMWARSVATLEAVIGVLYLTIIMARLVGLYAQEKTDLI